MTNKPSLGSLFKKEDAPTDDSAHVSPLAAANALQRRSHLVKKEFEDRVFRFPPDATTIRILPALPGSKYSWMFKIETYDLQGSVEYLVPSCIDNSRYDDPVATFRRYLYKNTDLAHRKGHKDEDRKLKLWTKKKAVVWFAHTQPDKLDNPVLPPLYLLIGSANDGLNGGNQGLMHRISELPDVMDEDAQSPTYRKRLYGSITDVETGRNITIKTSGKGRDRKYDLRPSSTPSSLEALFGQILQEYPDAITAILRPLEDVFYIPKDEELFASLTQYVTMMGAEKALKDCFGGPSAGSGTLVERETAAAPAAEVPPAPAPVAKAEVKAPTPAKETPAAPKPSPTPSPAPAPAAPAGLPYPELVEDRDGLKKFLRGVDLAKAQGNKAPEMTPDVEMRYNRMLVVYPKLTAEDQAMLTKLTDL